MGQGGFKHQERNEQPGHWPAYAHEHHMAAISHACAIRRGSKQAHISSGGARGSARARARRGPRAKLTGRAVRPQAGRPARLGSTLSLLPPEMNALFAHSFPSAWPAGAGVRPRRRRGRGYARSSSDARSSTLAGRPESSLPRAPLRCDAARVWFRDYLRRGPVSTCPAPMSAS